MTMQLSEIFGPVHIKDPDDIGSNPTGNRPMIDIIEARVSRRSVLGGLAAGGMLGVYGSSVAGRSALAADPASTLTFEEIEHGIDATHHAAKGYSANVLLRWGDKVFADSPAFDVKNLSAAAQEKQFGYNCDFIAYLPLPQGSSNSENGLLCVNHEYTNAELMFPALTADDTATKVNKDQADVEMAAHGVSVVEIRKTGSAWQVVADSKMNRRFPIATAQMTFSGPAAGNARLKTNADATGMAVFGTLNNCAGGSTPWGTYLTAEENFNGYFGGDAEKQPQAAAYKRYTLTKDSWYSWWMHHDRFNVEKEPNEPNRFGWIVEIDPYDPASKPVKRTALGRFKHEGATTVVNKDGRVVVYSGDDERFEYLYKFVTKGAYNPTDRAANLNLLDEGTLHVAKFSDDGKLQWLPLTHGEGPLTSANGFADQGDVMIETRRAADLVGATPMDRPEDVEPNPVTGKVYAVLTNNSRRKVGQIDAANPRFDNTAGHIIELSPPGEGKDADHAAAEFAWEHFIIAGNPTWGSTLYGKGTSANGWFAAPDGAVVDNKGRLWIASDQGASQSKFKTGDGVWACDTTGDGRAISKFFFRCPSGAEMAGPAFTPDNKTFFVSVQHPAEQEEGSTYDTPATRWPDFADDMPPRPSVVAITKDDGGEIGT
ncbi:MAG: PhoX family phosphatase [Pseudomonadota bacterium]|nr:PhoX family phosphatase [Pseudomonadota bacterium]